MFWFSFFSVLQYISKRKRKESQLFAVFWIWIRLDSFYFGITKPDPFHETDQELDPDPDQNETDPKQCLFTRSQISIVPPKYTKNPPFCTFFLIFHFSVIIIQFSIKKTSKMEDINPLRFLRLSYIGCITYSSTIYFIWVILQKEVFPRTGCS